MPGPLDNLGDQLFNEKPAKQQDDPFNPVDSAHRYVQSRIFGGSRGLEHNGTVPNRLSETAISDLVTNLDILGPYEHHILTSLLRAPQTLVIITGAPGSGKSSTLRNVLDFYDRNAVVNKAQIETGIVPKHVYIDFNKLEREFHLVEYKHKGSGLGFLYEKIPLRIAKAIMKSVQPIAVRQKVPPMQILLQLARDACQWSNMDEEPPDGIDFDWPDLLGFEEPKITGNPNQNFHNLQNNILNKSRQSSNFALIFWCAVLDVLAIKSLPTKRQTLLVLDNIDPFPDSIQISIRDEFIGLCLEKKFKVILALRQSRFDIYKKNDGLFRKNHHTVALNWYPHCGPNPVEVVCIRLLGFISNPQLYKAFEDLDAEWQKNAVNRALELFLRLTRGAPAFRSLGKLAIAGAGDSIRQALKAIRFLFESEEFSYNYTDNKEELILVKKIAIELQTIACASSIGLALREELIGMAMEFAGTPINDKLISCALNRFNKAFISTVRSFFKNKDELLTDCVNDLWKSIDIQKLCEEDIETGVRLLRSRICYFGITEKVINDYAKEFAENFKNKINDFFAPHPVPNGFMNLVFKVIGCLEIDDKQNFADTSHGDYHEFPFSLGHLQHCLGILSVNRPHVMTRSLVRNNYLHNLFVDSKGNLSTIPLTLVYFLANQDYGELQLSALLEIMETRANESEVMNLFNRFCNEMGRIIFINEDFSYESYEELSKLAKDNKIVRLTHSGWMYYHGVLDEFDYTIESLLTKGLKPRHGDLLSGRIEHALNQLVNLLEFSESAAKNPTSDLWSSIEISVVPDIIVRCTPVMIRAVRGHFAKMQDSFSLMSKDTRFAESVHTRAVTLSWHDLLIKAKNFACSGNFAERII